MDILVIPCLEMSERNEHRVVRLGSRLKECLGVIDGDVVQLDNKTFYVKGFYEVAQYPEEVACVSSSVFGVLPSRKSMRVASTTKLTIGCDPEFVLVDKKGSVVSANYILPFEGQLGSDAGLGELRPSPSESRLEVLKNLRELIKQIPNKTYHTPVGDSFYKGWSTGFHIHFGMPAEILTYTTEHSDEFMKNTVAVLDYFVGIPAMLADATDKRRLSAGDYGKPGDYRITDCTLEYRTPGGFHLRHPWYARALLDTAYLVMYNILGYGSLSTKLWTSMGEFFTYDHLATVMKIPLSKNDIKSILVSDSRSTAIKELPRILKVIQSFYGFNQLKNSVSKMFEPYPRVSPLLLNNWI